MKIGIDCEYIEIVELDRTPIDSPCGAGDVNVKVSVQLQDFRGMYGGIWFEVTAIKDFIGSLESLDISRKGSAKITSMSPEEFALEIRSSDNLGHMEIEVYLHRYQYSGSKNWPIYLRGGFEAQPENIKQLTSCFKAFTN